MELSVAREGDAIEGGEFRYALAGDPFSGIKPNVLVSVLTDLVSFFTESLYG